MAITIKTLPNRYPENTVLNSLKTGYLNNENSTDLVLAGGYITLPKKYRKIAITDRLGPVVIDRYFMQLDNDKLIPVYLKIYDPEEANVLLFINGIEHIKQRLGNINSYSVFLKDVLLESVINELDKIAPEIATEVLEYLDVPSGNSLIANDTTIEVSATQTRAFLANDIVNQSSSTIPGNYPWNLIDTDTDIASWNTVCTPKKLAGHLLDISVQVNLYENINKSISPLFVELEDQFAPNLGTVYTKMAYDSLTHLMIHHSELTEKQVRQRLIPSTSDLDRRLIINEDIMERAEIITTFDSNLMMFCTLIHQLPLHEFQLKYTLCKQSRNWSIEFSNILIRDRRMIAELQYLTTVVIPELIRGWGSDITEITIIKTGDEELLIGNLVSNMVKYYYIDLFMTTLLSQNITHYGDRR